MTMERFGLMSAPMLLGAVLLSACAAQTADTSGAGAAAPEATTAPALSSSCDAEKVQDIVGQAYSDALAENARKASGATTLRIIRPGQAVTMDFRQDRLNLELDAEEKIVRARCG
ncbi:I78 family peptidase inhibitor [Pedomonas mirosovicensis]|uniref:I78 family peptidase inhibitor n=1 Tax=Pedomonas mirosovicensis TaxID=2908641 RepID=UPI002167FFE6|nr:I78 family peptidase inhibitor [Pedomonas mirosovicensis]MCH8686561.1 hypothetical protein [Pedomonas mirosovicensis]